MKNKFQTVFLALLACSSFLAFRLADNPFENILKKLSIYNENYPQEKVHLHLDKPYYAIGDNIWFKAYVKDSRSNQLSKISNALYVELIAENDSVKRQIKLPLIDGLTWGDFKLPDTLSEGNYRIRAYTQWMRNAGPDYFFDKTIKIGNAWANKVFTQTAYTYTRKGNTEAVDAKITFTDKQGNAYGGQNVSYQVQLKDKTIARGKGKTNAQGEISFSFSQSLPAVTVAGKITAVISLPNKQEVVKTIPVKASPNNITVSFYPESGTLVENLPSKLGIKAVNAAGLGEDIEGTIMDDNGAEIVQFKTTHLGMGNTMLNPQPGRTYTAKVNLKSGGTLDIVLPKVQPQGYVLNINNTDSAKVNAKIILSEAVLNQGELKLVMQHNSNVLAVLKTNSSKQLTTFSLPKKDLPSGIINFTLFNVANLPVAERMIFVNNPVDLIDVKLNNLKKTYGLRENVEMEFSAKDAGKATQGSFSIAVTNTSIVKPDVDNESNILTSFLLSSDLKGYIEKPNYYLQQNDSQTREDLDNLMLTQGWTRVLWATVLNTNQKPPVYKAEKFLQVSGTITSLGGKPVAGGRVSLFSTSGGVFMTDTLTDANGRFIFDQLSFGDSTKFIVQARNAKNKKNIEINLDIIPGQVVTKSKNTGDLEINVNESIKSYIQQSEDYFNELTKRGLLEHSYLLNQVNIVEKKNPAKNSSNLNGAGNADFIMTAKDLGTCVTLSQCLQGRVAGMIIRDGQAFLMRNNGIPMQIILDGMNVQPNFLDNIQPFDVETIEILKNVANTTIYGSRGNGGVLIITTKRGGGDLSYTRYSPGIMTYAPKGYYAVRQFYAPQHGPESSDKSPDKRSTVYWTPHFPIDSNGAGKLNFYNTDQVGTYRIVIEGINDEGHLARKVYTYEVK